MTISVGAIIGALFAIAIIYVLIRMLFNALAASSVSIPPVVPIVVWGLVTIVAIFIIAWAFGIAIPFVTLG